MKDNTAAVHVQVPVEVASFLLNEKRPRSPDRASAARVNVTWCPTRRWNAALQTRTPGTTTCALDDTTASYKMAEEFEDPPTSRAAARADQPPGPVIKGVLPDVPAPQPVPGTGAGGGRHRRSVAAPTARAPQAGGLMAGSRTCSAWPVSRRPWRPRVSTGNRQRRPGTAAPAVMASTAVAARVAVADRAAATAATAARAAGKGAATVGRAATARVTAAGAPASAGERGERRNPRDAATPWSADA